MLFRQATRRMPIRAEWTAGKSMDMSVVRTVMTTISSMSVKPRGVRRRIENLPRFRQKMP